MPPVSKRYRHIQKSPSMRREWIEIVHFAAVPAFPHMSPSMRREWIEILAVSRLDRRLRASPSMRREWIEIFP